MSSITKTFPSSSSTEIMKWNSPIPYLFGGLALILGAIAIALIVLACTYIYKKKQLPASSSSFDTGSTLPVVDYDKPKIVVIMAGDDNPSYIAMPVNSIIKTAAKDADNAQV